MPRVGIVPFECVRRKLKICTVQASELMTVIFCVENRFVLQKVYFVRRPNCMSQQNNKEKGVFYPEKQNINDPKTMLCLDCFVINFLRTII